MWISVASSSLSKRCVHNAADLFNVFWLEAAAKHHTYHGSLSSLGRLIKRRSSKPKVYWLLHEIHRQISLPRRSLDFNLPR